MLYCFVLSAINHKYISSSQLKIQTRNLWWRFILISSICSQSIMTTPRSLDKKKITRWPSTTPALWNILHCSPPLLWTSWVQRGVAWRLLWVVSLSHWSNVLTGLTGDCSQLLSGLLATDTCWTRGAPAERDAGRSNTILCCPTHWVSQTLQTGGLRNTRPQTR